MWDDGRLGDLEIWYGVRLIQGRGLRFRDKVGVFGGE